MVRLIDSKLLMLSMLKIKKAVKSFLQKKINSVDNLQAIECLSSALTLGSGAIIQIGANDGVQNDFVRPIIKNYSGKVLLVEPIPYYCSKLELLYKDKPNITILNAFIGEVSDFEKSRTIYYIEPTVAGQMDGNGPADQWAHGQGSFDKKYNRVD